MSDWTFPSEILCPLDRPSLPHRETRLVDYYRAKRQLIKECEPERILEFGIRAGYSAWTFLTACPGATYVGVDNEQGEHDPEPLTFWARKILEPFDTTFILADSRTLQPQDLLGAYDFIHVDGDHSFAGATHDMEIGLIVLQPGGTMVIDDYDNIQCPEVRPAVDAFAKKHSELEAGEGPSPSRSYVFRK